MVPRGAFAWVTARLRGAVRVPLITTNRINDPAVADAILARGDADMVSMARPFLADADFVNKAAEGRADEINTCIACNQACLDHIFERRIATCLVNPFACRETEIVARRPRQTRKRIAVVGAGPAGLACATTAAERGHRVTLFEAASEIGGQFNLARRIPGKEEFAETLRYYGRRLARLGVDVRLGAPRRRADDLRRLRSRSILATGVVPRAPAIDGLEHPRVASYVDIVEGRRDGGPRRRDHRRRRHRLRRRRVPDARRRGDGHASDGARTIRRSRRFATSGASTPTYANAGRRRGRAAMPPPPRNVWLLQRKTTKVGEGLAKTTGWIRRTLLRRRGVTMLAGVELRAHRRRRPARCASTASRRCFAVDTIVICAGQEPRRELAAALGAARASRTR